MCRVYAPPKAPRGRGRARDWRRRNDEATLAWRTRMATDAAQAIYKERAATAECVNAQARNRGLQHFVVRGLRKAWAATIDYTPDHLPILGPVLADGGPVSGTVVAAAGGHGMMWGPGVSKAATLECLCNTRGIGKHEVIAFGDMPNDLSVLGWAGTAYAMGNAHPLVKQACTNHAPPNTEDGVAQILESLFRL